MNPIIELLKENNISDQQINEIFTELTQNPLMAMATIGNLGIPPEQLQPVMMQVMTKPVLIKEAVAELGLDMSAVEQAKRTLDEQK